jgi:ribonuclease I
MRRGSLEVVAALLIALLCMPDSASARHRNRDTEAPPGEFDYYLLSLSWSPAFCLSSPGAAECDGPRRYGFIVHGLWPQNERGWPQYCNVHVPVPDEVVQAMAEIMPSRQLVYHEWSAHGTCSGQSVPRLREVHICLDRDLKARACSAAALRQACRAPLLLVAPIR